MKKLNQFLPTYVATFIRHVNLIKHFGIDIFEEPGLPFLKRHGVLIIFVILLAVMLNGQILYVVKKNEIGATFVDVVTAIPSIFIVIQDFVKILVVLYKRKEIRKVITEISELWPTDITDIEKNKILNRWTGLLKRFDNAFFISAIISLHFFELLPLGITIYDMNTKDDAQYQFPLQIYYFCFLESHLLYTLAYFYQSFVCTMGHLCIYVSCDFLLVDLTFDVSALLDLLQMDLINVVKADSWNKNFDEDNCDDIKPIIIKHQKLLNLTKTLSEIFGEIIFSQVSFSSIVICCYGFMAIIADGMFLKNCTASLGVMFAIFVLAWPGQMLADASAKMAEAAYECRWFERGKKFRKCIDIIIARSQNECKLSGLGFSELTLTMFSKVVSTSWSYLSLLNQMYEGTEF